MSGVNKVILLGNLGADPDHRETPNGLAVTRLSLATSETWKDKTTGEKKESTEWHRVVLFGRVAEIAAKYLEKGSKAYIEGRLQTRKWQDQSGNDRYTTEIVASGLQLLSGGRSDGDRYERDGGGQSQAAARAEDSGQWGQDDDVPF